MTQPRSFLALGECMVEIAPAGDGLFRRGFAGDTFNTAWYARRLLGPDWTVAYGSCIGDDAISAEMSAFMAEQGIDTGALRVIPDRTVGLYMISVDNGERSFSYWRGQSAARRLAENAEWLAQLLAGRDVIHFSGITLAILPPDGRQVLCSALAQARAAGATVAFDTNLRPRLWDSPQAMRDGLQLGASVADVVLPSFDEETGLFGDATPDDTVARYRAAGAGLVAVKDGAGPLTLWSDTDGTIRRTPAPVARIVDTTAAGDSFAAALLAGLATGQTAETAADHAMALAGQVIQAPGALVPGLFETGEFR
ncbi:sugar kinase [Seohaeicola saemankumensis]|nr:sugar kinase [Seohaeicola saemankumensis]MCA0870809.1 sugar kinase [Seohaeicola saemankumensis]